MVSSTIALHGVVVATFAVIACSAEEQIPVLGGWQKHNVSDDAIYEELAHFAVSKQVANREFFDTVLEIVDVESQTVAGTNYRIKFKITESTCPITAAYNKATCLPKSRETIKDVCTAAITDVPWTKVRELTSFTCEGSTVSH
ncbi:salivary cystatin-L2-like [Rhipicephalus sanguineus]|uniref:salivary cystatin-L2-like n=1 Tax=Rhipicephalus sanguineus TaxID=34632 RepID=UPI0018941070|nr:salivary cystatin-L2-like [Rhipicephalus sanguineus]